MFGGRKPNGISPCPKDVVQSNMAVAVIDTMDVHPTRGPKRFRFEGILRQRRRVTDRFNVFRRQAGFLRNFPEERLVSVLAEFYVPARRQPLPDLAVIHKKHAAIMNNEGIHDEINEFMDVRHDIFSATGGPAGCRATPPGPADRR